MTTPLPIGLRRLMKYAPRLVVFSIIGTGISAASDRYVGKPFDTNEAIAVSLVMFLSNLWLERAYRRGQIDAMNGIVKYEKQTNEDGETVWREKSEASK